MESVAAFAVESVAGLLWNQWQLRVEQVAALPWNQWQDSPGIGGSFGVEYAHGYPREKTTVFLHEPSMLRSPSRPACLRFNILVQKNNVREIRADMSTANRSQLTWVQSDVCGLFSVWVRSFSDNLGLSAIIFSVNVGTKLRCSRAERFMFSRRYT